MTPENVTVTRKSSIQALAWSGVNAILSLTAKLGSLVILSWILGPAEFGAYNVGLSLALIAATIAQLGVPTNLVQNDSSEPSFVASAVLTGLLSSIAISCALAVFFWCAPSVTLGAPDRAILYAYLPYVVLQVFVNMMEALCRRMLDFRRLATSEIVGSLGGNLIVSLALALLGYGVWSLVIGQIAYVLIKALMLVRVNFKRMRAKPTLRHVREGLRSSLSITIAETANIAAVHVQRPLVAAALGAASAGIWSRVYQVVLIQLTVFIQPLDNLVLPLFSRIRSDERKLNAAFFIAFELIGLVTLPLAVVTAALAPLAVPIAFGPAWSAMIVPLQIGSFILFFRAVDRVLLSIARALGTTGLRSVLQVLQLVMVVGAVLLTMRMGLVGLSLGYLGALAINFVLTVAMLGFTGGLRATTLLKALLPGLIVSVPAVAGGVLVALMAPGLGAWSPPLVTIIILGLATLVVLLARKRLLSPMLLDMIEKAAAAALGRLGRRPAA